MAWYDIDTEQWGASDSPSWLSSEAIDLFFLLIANDDPDPWTDLDTADWVSIDPTETQTQTIMFRIVVGGEWKEAQEASVLISGEWKTVESVYVLINGAWLEGSG